MATQADPNGTVMARGIMHMSNREYHANKSHLSSSSLKLLLDDPHRFYEEKILGKSSPLEGVHFDEGSLFHALILEPHTVAQDFAFFDGMRKQGEAWEEFKASNPGRVLMSTPQKTRVQYWVQSYRRQTAAVGLISGGEAEHSLFNVLQGVPVKVRCDYINVEKGYIVDLKTSGFPVDRDSFMLTVDKYKYHLSAALYCKVAELQYGKPFDFYFVAVCKKEPDCQVFVVSPETRHLGDQMVSKALATYVQCLKTGIWRKPDEKVLDFGDDYEILSV
jgi:hypothetical protein